MPNKDLDIGEPNDFENEVKDYWAGVIAGDTKLENGEIFNDNNFYNSKHLKYEPGVIRGVLLALALSGNNDDNFKQICQVAAMQTACFDDDIKDVIKTRVSQSMEITKKYEDKKNKEELLEMAKEIALVKEVEPYTHEELQILKKRKALIFGKQVSI